MILASFQVKNKLKTARFFQKIFLVTNINIIVILNMFFLALNNADILFIK